MKKIKTLRTRKDFIKSIMNYYKEYYPDGGFPTIFSLQQKMLEMGICPRCGKQSQKWSSGEGHFPCWECDFRITPNEIEKVLDEEKPNKKILIKRLKGKRKWVK